MKKSKIFIVDDSPINHEILKEIVSPHYDIDQAFDGEQALSMIRSRKDAYSLVLLDIVMPKMDGFQVLEYLNTNSLLDGLPVVIISAETDVSQIQKAYDLGAVDYINRPFDKRIILRRIQNTLAVYRRKKSLEDLVVRQFFTIQRNNVQMIEILANLVEFHNGETADHIIHIRTFTSIILHELKRIAPQYHLTSEKITDITTASSLHDIGKIAIPPEILGKPGRFNDDEFAIMKTHAEKGAMLLEKSEGFKSSSLIKTARDVAMWHHERFDGKGYPDGLAGDQIPISAQVVSLADVYDALISERCYKAAYSHEKAVEMILNGECGIFNPVLMQCLRNLAPTLKEGFSKKYLQKIENDEIRESASRIMECLH